MKRAIKSSYPALSVSGNVIHGTRGWGEGGVGGMILLSSYFVASWPKVSTEVVKISAHFTGLGFLINIQQSNFTQSHILTA